MMPLPAKDIEPILSVSNISMQFKGIKALSEVSFEVNTGEIFAIIGPNGAGKTTLFNIISRVYRPDAGEVRFSGQDLLRLKRHRLASAGISRTFQNLGLFPQMSVMDNILVGCHHLMISSLIGDGLKIPYVTRQEQEHRKRCEEIIDFLNLGEWVVRPVQTLPYGVQKKVELGRALAVKPVMLLLDEPVAGMNNEETEEIACLVLEIKETFGITQVLVEHDMSLVMGIADRVMVLDYGKQIALGSPEQVRHDPQVIKAYLGEV